MLALDVNRANGRVGVVFPQPAFIKIKRYTIRRLFLFYIEKGDISHHTYE